MVLIALVAMAIGCASNNDVVDVTVPTNNEVVRVAIPILHHSQPDAVGPEIYEEMSKYFLEETGKQLEVRSIRLDQLKGFDPALLHIVGSAEVRLEPWERSAIDSQQLSGGTVLIENYRGDGAFVASLRDQLTHLFLEYDEPVSTRSDIITGRHLPEGRKRNRRVEYRNAPEEFQRRMLLRGTEWIGPRYPILFSYEDISHAMQGLEDPAVVGYTVSYARDLMLNILLEADQSQKSQRY